MENHLRNLSKTAHDQVDVLEIQPSSAHKVDWIAGEINRKSHSKFLGIAQVEENEGLK